MHTVRRALVMAPTSLERRAVVRALHARPSTVDGVTVYRGRRGGVDVIVAQAGVGPSVAARTAEDLLDRFTVDHVVVCGIAGGIDATTPVGRVVIPEVVVEVASGREFRPVTLGGGHLSGTVGTVDELIMDPVRLSALMDQGLCALEMESSGVGAVCDARGVPWSVIRVISDRPDDGLTEEGVMDLLRPDGSSDTVGALRMLVSRPERIPRFLRLGRDASAAAHRAARCTLEALDAEGGRGGGAGGQSGSGGT